MEKEYTGDVIKDLFSNNKFLLDKSFLSQINTNQDNTIQIIDFETDRIADIQLQKILEKNKMKIDKNNINIFLYLSEDKALLCLNNFNCLVVNYKTGEILKHFTKAFYISRKYGLIKIAEDTSFTGIIDFNGNEILPPKYKDIFIDEKTGRLTAIPGIKYEYPEMDQFIVTDTNGKIIAKDNIQIIKQNKKFGVVDVNETTILPPIYNDIKVDDVNKIIIAVYEKDIRTKHIDIVGFDGHHIFSDDAYSDIVIKVFKTDDFSKKVSGMLAKNPELLTSSKPIKEKNMYYEIYVTYQKNTGDYNKLFIKDDTFEIVPDSLEIMPDSYTIKGDKIIGIAYREKKEKGNSIEQALAEKNKFYLINDKGKTIFGPFAEVKFGEDAFMYIKITETGAICGFADYDGNVLYGASSKLRKAMNLKPVEIKYLDFPVKDNEGEKYSFCMYGFETNFVVKNIIPIMKDGKYGLMDYDGNVIVKPEYNTIGYIKTTNEFILHGNGKDTLIKKDGQTVMTANSINIASKDEKYLAISDKEKSGIILAESKKWIINPVKQLHFYHLNDLGDIFGFCYYLQDKDELFSITLDKHNNETIGTFLQSPEIDFLNYALLKIDFMKVKNKEKANEEER